MIIMFSIIPVDKGESLSASVAEAVDLVDKSGLPYQVTAMGTLVEGEWDELMALVKRCHLAIREGSKRVYTRVNIDDREGAANQLSGKVASVEKKIGREIRK